MLSAPNSSPQPVPGHRATPRLPCRRLLAQIGLQTVAACQSLSLTISLHPLGVPTISLRLLRPITYHPHDLRQLATVSPPVFRQTAAELRRRRAYHHHGFTGPTSPCPSTSRAWSRFQIMVGIRRRLHVLSVSLAVRCRSVTVTAPFPVRRPPVICRTISASIRRACWTVMGQTGETQVTRLAADIPHTVRRAAPHLPGDQRQITPNTLHVGITNSHWRRFCYMLVIDWNLECRQLFAWNHYCACLAAISLFIAALETYLCIHHYYCILLIMHYFGILS